MRVLSLFLIFSFLTACDGINEGWVADGGGYIKYHLDGDGPYEFELLPESVQIPYRERHYFYALAIQSTRKDTLAFMVHEPSLGKNSVVSHYTYFIREGGLKAAVIQSGSYVSFDQRDDSTWTADLNLFFKSCNKIECSESGQILLTGRLRYWVPH